jgi:adenylate cyclase, class 2
MPVVPKNQEVEIKLQVTDVGALLRRLKQLHARMDVPRTYESNTLYDTPKKNLARKGQLIRIRVEKPSPSSNRSKSGRPATFILTYKGPARSSKAHKRFKVREEVEVNVSGDGIAQILTALGLRPIFRYEKFRTTYTLPGIRNLKIEIDETPIGIFLELEGAPSAIDRAARRLGYAREDYITATYSGLYLAYCRRQGQKPGDLLFRHH